MLRLLAVITAATARPENATAYFDAASRLWPPTTAAGRCLRWASFEVETTPRSTASRA